MDETIDRYLIWYADGVCYNDWVHAPKIGIQCIMLYHPSGNRTIIQGEDEYFDPLGLSYDVKYGTEINLEEYMAIVHKALAHE